MSLLRQAVLLSNAEATSSAHRKGRPDGNHLRGRYSAVEHADDDRVPSDTVSVMRV